MREPNPEAKAPERAPEGGAMWAMLVGGAIFVIAGLLIFWPGGDLASGGPGGRSGGSQAQSGQASAGGGEGGVGLGVSAREADPARGRGEVPRVNPNILPAGGGGLTLAPPSPPQPEPTSFASAAEELRYYEKKLEQARQALSQRTTFLERSKKARDAAATPEARDRAEKRHQIVEQNYNTASQAVAELEKKVAALKQR